MSFAFRPSIRYRLLLAFAAYLVLLGLLSLWIEGQARRALEDELGRKLVAVAAATAASLPADFVPIVSSFRPGDEGGRSHGIFKRRLVNLQGATGVERLGIWSFDGRILVDSRPGTQAGAASVTGELYAGHLERAADGAASASILFTGEGGRVYKLGFHPLTSEHGTPVAAVVAEGNATFLAAARTVRRVLLLAGLGALLFGALVAWWLASGVTRPLERLAHAARLIGQGDLETPVPSLGSDEVGELGGTLEGMRVGLHQRDQQLRAMVAGVAHEIRNPLGGLVLYADLLRQDDALSDEARQQAGKILAEAHNLERTVEEFLIFARPAEPHPEVVDLPMVWEEVRPLVEGRLCEGRAGSKIEIRWEEDWGGDADARSVRADPRQIRQILLNLVLNAAEALDSNGGTVRVATRRKPEAFVMTVEDSGDGIDPSRYDEILQPFVTSKPRGAGLGLPMVQHLARAHGGDLELDRSELGGLAARVLIPQRDGVRTDSKGERV